MTIQRHINRLFDNLGNEYLSCTYHTNVCPNIDCCLAGPFAYCECVVVLSNSETDSEYKQSTVEILGIALYYITILFQTLPTCGRQCPEIYSPNEKLPKFGAWRVLISELGHNIIII